MTEWEKKRRREDENVQSIKITTDKDKKDFVFISYKSDDWEKALHEIVFKLQKKYGLRVYFDKAFDEKADTWITQFIPQMQSSKCKAVLAFITDEYYVSYATLMEMMCSRTELAKVNGQKMKVIPVNLSNLTNKYTDDDDNTGLGVETFEDGSTNPNWEKELEAFNYLIAELQDTKIVNRYIYRVQAELEACPYDGVPYLKKRVCSKIMGDVWKDIGGMNVNDGSNKDICKSVVDKLKNAGYELVFDPALIDNSIDWNSDEWKKTTVPPEDTMASVAQHGTATTVEFYPTKPPEPLARIVLSADQSPKQSVGSQVSAPLDLSGVKAEAPVWIARKPAPAPKVKKTLCDQPANSKRGKPEPRAIIDECRTHTNFQSYRGCVTKDTTVGEFRMLMEQEEFCWWLRAVREGMSMTEGIAVGCFHYVMAVILGGCNRRSSSLCKANYSKFLVSDTPGPNAKDNGTWPSALGSFLGTGRKPDDARMKACEEMPESTTMQELRKNFQNAASELYQTKSNDKIDRLFEVFFTDSWVAVLEA